ncbi:MAG: ferritin family protein [Candidatus Aminicenantes bacterium]|nr:ferritin family protein [Candidatus Aminicenantes bacterium]
MSELKSELQAIAFKNVDEALDFAIKSEENANLFYTEWAKKVGKKSLQGVFEDLAEEELGHKEFLLRIKKGETFQSTSRKITDLKISDYLLDVQAAIDMDYQDALTLAMHREKTAFMLYSKLAELSEDKGMKDTFNLLAQQEAKHKLRLELIYDEEILQEN